MEKNMETDRLFTVLRVDKRIQGLCERRLLFIVWLINRIYNPWSLISFALYLTLFLTGNLQA